MYDYLVSRQLPPGHLSPVSWGRVRVGAELEPGEGYMMYATGGKCTGVNVLEPIVYVLKSNIAKCRLNHIHSHLSAAQRNASAFRFSRLSLQFTCDCKRSTNCTLSKLIYSFCSLKKAYTFFINNKRRENVNEIILKWHVIIDTFHTALSCNQPLIKQTVTKNSSSLFSW